MEATLTAMQEDNSKGYKKDNWKANLKEIEKDKFKDIVKGLKKAI